jgi:pimeloyl-ACP methyl ester carboxylesterase
MGLKLLRRAPEMVLGIVLLTGGSACTIVSPPATVPMASIAIGTPNVDSGPLIVLLPGMGDRASTFIESGFIQASTDSPAMFLAADAHSGYYFSQTIVSRLHEDVIAPAAGNASEVWLLGVSMGGLGSILYAIEHPETVAGIVLLAPYLGARCVAEEIQTAGGLSTWSGQSECADAFGADVWNWLKTSVATGHPKIFLAYGTSDRLSATYAPLRGEIPYAQVFTADGGHNWKTWNRLWGAINRSGLVP